MVAVAAVVFVVVVFVVVGVDGIECSYLIAVIVAQAIYSTGRNYSIARCHGALSVVTVYN